MKKLSFAITVLLSLFVTNLFASHYMGGEITWKCQGNGQYVFIMKTYRECNGINYGNSYNLTVTDGATGANVIIIPVNLISQTDISPICNSDSSFTHISCYPLPITPNTGAIEEYVYKSNPVTLNGTPPAQGWIIHWGSCCRNPSTNLTNASSKNFELRAVMYPLIPHGSTTPLPANPCYDSSPVFEETASTVLCTSYPFIYNNNAYDAELDSLVYEWGLPWETYNVSLSGYAPGYSHTNPLPDSSFNPNNVAAVIDTHTGDISFESYTQGAFVTSVKASTYRCKQLIAEIYREMQVVLLNCDSNTPPDVTAPFKDPASGLYTLYTDTVYAGDSVTFSISGTDFEFLDPPANTMPQTMTIEVSGSQFASPMFNPPTGCLNPPCATLSPVPPVIGQFGVATTFAWKTECNHIANTGCGVNSNVYTFLIKVKDDFCPVPASNIKTITIVVLDQPRLPAPDIRCVEVDSNGNVTLTWIPPDGPDSTFNSYHIFTSLNPTGPFTVLDSIFNYTDTVYTHTGANANIQPVYYYMMTRSGCYGRYYSQPTDTLSSIFLSAVNNGTDTTGLTWNAIHTPDLPSSTGWYKIYKEYPSGTWTLIDSTHNLQYSDTDTSNCALVKYKIEIGDSIGCSSISSVAKVSLQNISEFDTDYSIKINPNPSKGTFIISINGIKEVKKVSVTNLQGQEIYSKQLNPATKQEQISLTGCAKGIYFLKLQSNEVVKAEKIVIQ